MAKKKFTAFGAVVRKALIDKNMTQVELANKIGTSKQYLRHILSGERSGDKYIDDIVNILELESFKISA